MSEELKPLVAVTIELTEGEYLALAMIAVEESRLLRQQARHFVLQAIMQRGLVQPSDLHPYMEPLPDRPSDLIAYVEPQRTVVEPAPKLRGGRVKSQSTIPTKYNAKGEITVHWKVYALFVGTPTKLYTRKNIREATGLKDNQIGPPLDRMLKRGVVRAVSSATEGKKEVRVYQITPQAKAEWDRRQEQLTTK